MALGRQPDPRRRQQLSQSTGCRFVFSLRVPSERAVWQRQGLPDLLPRRYQANFGCGHLSLVLPPAPAPAQCLLYLGPPVQTGPSRPPAACTQAIYRWEPFHLIASGWIHLLPIDRGPFLVLLLQGMREQRGGQAGGWHAEPVGGQVGGMAV